MNPTITARVERALSSDLDLNDIPPDEQRALHAALLTHAAELDVDGADDAALDQFEQVLAAVERFAAALAAPADSPVDASDRVADLRRRRDAIAASGQTRRPTMAQLAAQTRPQTPATTRPRMRLQAALTAGAHMGPLSGSEIARSELAKATMDKLAALRRSTGNERHATAAMVWEYPEDRRLGDDVFANTARLDEHLSEVAILASVEEQGGLQAIVAAGGICGPTAADWQVDVLGSQARPLRDSLPSYQAVRGGVRFTPPPTLAGVGGSATAVWTAANDANPTSPATKPVQTFACPNPVEEFVDALPTRLQFSNFQGRFSPEIVEANTELALANAARVAEVNLLVKMASGSTRTGAGSLVSFSRDLFPVLDVLATGMRYRHRLPNGEAGAPVFPLRAVFPSWVRGALRTDLTRELAHDRAVASSDVLALTDAYITTMFAARGIIPTWVMDGLPRSTGGSTLGTNAYDYPDQFFAAPGANSSLSAPPADASAGSAAAGTYWPSRLTFFLFPEGTWLFLDGGRIDLGVITDSTLNATNQYQTFVEPFEGLAKRGAESLQVVVPVKPSGASVAGITPPSTFAY